MDREHQQQPAPGHSGRFEPACPICGNPHWHTPPVVNDVTLTLGSGEALTAQPSICTRCNFVRLTATNSPW